MATGDPVVQRQAEEAREEPIAPPPSLGFPVVGVGASAGGLEAFTQLLQSLPPAPGIAFLFVQHIEPNRESMLTDVLSKVTAMSVSEAKEGVRLEPNHVYIIPPGTDMAVQGGMLRLSPRKVHRSGQMPVDHLFRSLAEDLRNRAIGVILSGGGTDGALGFQAIKAEGGVTFAQDEKTAQHDSMPRSAILEGCVDYVLPPAEISQKLMRVARHAYATQPADAAPPAHDGVFSRILAYLREHTDVDFSQYKRSTILRRIRRRMALRGLDALDDYLLYLEHTSGEAQHLYQDFLIRVTRFFRDEAVFTALKEKVFPGLVADRSPASTLRVWVAGCSTGEEVYSLAISLLEYLGDQNQTFPIKILATDLNEAALERARAGVYLDNIELDVSPDRLRRFFAKVNGHYQISKVVRDLCIFSRHNLTHDPPFSRLDLVSCRNLLIYLDTSLQKRVVPMLHYALNPGGYLVLGSSETIGSFTDLFAPVDQKHRIFTRTALTAASLSVDFGAFVETTTAARRPTPPGPAGWSALDVQEADRVLLSRYAPVGVVVDENMTVLQFRGRTGPYLEPAPGLASLDLLKMVREGLLGEVRAAVNQAKTENATFRKEGVLVKEEKDQFRQINLEVVPIKIPPSGLRCFLVLFSDTPAPAEAAPAAPRAPGAEAREAALEQQVAQLQQELTSTREYLQSIIEEHESTCEELKSANEEIMSSNEELQSTNEELQTAKEETQSANEELATLNEELQHRNAQMAQVNNDLMNFLSAVNIPIVMVGRDLRVRRFTPMAEKVLNLIASDVGRPITDIKPNLQHEDLGRQIAHVIDTLTPLEKEVQDTEGRWYALRIRPYITLENRIEGASVTLFDIHDLKQSLERQRKSGGGM